ncbi:MAG: glycosyltransferase family 4 protein [Muribaculaceae bacterium]|nr:glycosyltransferase family 4 protein [Muribaculaceae bacterium]
MKILYIHQYFHTPDEPGGTRSYWISKELIRRGHQVVMVASTNKNHPEEKVEIIDGIEVHYVKNDYNNYMSKVQKVQSFLRFMRKSIKYASKINDVDIVFATSTPLTVGAVALKLKKTRGLKYVFEVRDLWPEFPIQIGAIKNPLVIKALRAFERKIYKNSEHVVALSPGMQDGVVSAGTPESKVTMIPNMSKPDEFYPHDPNLEVAKQFGLDNREFNIIHFGSMGPANGLSYIIETAKLCQDQGLSDVKFIFMGDGATQPILKKMVEEYKLTNVKFLGNHKMSVVSEVVNLCDLSMTSFKNLPILATNSPNKLFDSLSAGKPIVVNSAGWTKDLAENEECGFYVDPDNPQDFVDKIKLYKDNKELLDRWERNARRLSETTFDKAILSSKVADVIEKAAK